MPKKMIAPNTTLWFVPKAGMANYLTPTAAEINAGVNISCAVVTGYTLGPTDSDTDTTRSICDSANVATPTLDNYEASLTLFRGILAETTGVYHAAYTALMVEGVEGYLVRRLGKANTELAVSGDVVEVYGVETDFPRVVEADNNGPIQQENPFLAKGEMNLFYTLAA